MTTNARDNRLSDPENRHRLSQNTAQYQPTPVDYVLIFLVLRGHLDMMVVEIHQLEVAHV